MAKRKEIKWRREGRGTMTGRQDGIIFRIFRLWDAQERGHTVSGHCGRQHGRHGLHRGKDRQGKAGRKLQPRGGILAQGGGG